jgi:hypothetical protein
MCDYSLHHVKSRPAKVGDKLRTVNFNTGTRGFAAPEDSTTAVCVLPGTELAFFTFPRCRVVLLRWRRVPGCREAGRSEPGAYPVEGD